MKPGDFYICVEGDPEDSQIRVGQSGIIEEINDEEVRWSSIAVDADYDDNELRSTTWIFKVTEFEQRFRPDRRSKAGVGFRLSRLDWRQTVRGQRPRAGFNPPRPIPGCLAGLTITPN